MNFELPHTNDDAPTIRFLVVADLDVRSASALAEGLLPYNSPPLDVSRIDACIVCGSLTRSQDLNPGYLYNNDNSTDNNNSNNLDNPWLRPREHSAALEGLVGSVLSQIETIACRVLFVPGSTDPVQCLGPPQRYTPNARNLHQEWIALAPGLGCAGYCQSSFVSVDEYEISMSYKDVYWHECDAEFTEDDLLEYRAEYKADAGASNNNSIEPRYIRIAQQQSRETLDVTLSQLLEIPRIVAANDKVKQKQLLSSLKKGRKSSKNIHKDSGVPLALPFSQTILVTHYSSDTVAEYESFLQSDICQEHMLLHIVSGGTDAELVDKHDKAILYPGSLRGFGDYCTIDVQLVECIETKKYKWQVCNAQFYTLPDYEA